MELRKRIELLVVCFAVCGTGVPIGARLHKQALERRLVSAVARDDAAAVVDLLNRGVAFRRTVRGPITIVSMACSKGARRTLTALLRRGERPGNDDICMPALHNDAEMVDLLLSAGASPNARANGRFPLLITLAEDRQTDMIKRLVRSGADPNVPYIVTGYWPRGFTPLMVSVSQKDLIDTKTLLDSGARVDCKVTDQVSNIEGYTALMIAETHKAADEVALLLLHGAKTDTIASDGNTPMTLASQNGEMLRLLAQRQKVK